MSNFDGSIPWLTRGMLGYVRFWIKYASRDDVEFLCKGSNGSEEMREAAANEPGDSPLYGFIRFRRRNILIKYVPEGTSRVLKGKLDFIPGRPSVGCER